MTLAYNIQPSHVDIIIKAGDTLNMTFRALLNDGSDPAYPAGDPYYYYDLSGMQLDIKFKRKDGLTVKSISSGGIAPAVTIAASLYNMTDTGFAVPDVLDYDVQVTDGTDIFTIQEGECHVKKQIT